MATVYVTAYMRPSDGKHFTETPYVKTLGWPKVKVAKYVPDSMVQASRSVTAAAAKARADKKRMDAAVAEQSVPTVQPHQPYVPELDEAPDGAPVVQSGEVTVPQAPAQSPETPVVAPQTGPAEAEPALTEADLEALTNKKLDALAVSRFGLRMPAEHRNKESKVGFLLTQETERQLG